MVECEVKVSCWTTDVSGKSFIFCWVGAEPNQQNSWEMTQPEHRAVKTSSAGYFHLNNTDVFWSKGQRLKIKPSLLFHSSWELHSQLCVIYFIWKCIRFQKQNGWWNREHVMMILWSNTHWTFNDSLITSFHHCGRLSDHEGLLRFQTCCL